MIEKTSIRPRPVVLHDRETIEAEREFHARMVDHVDASIAEQRGMAAPWPSRLLRLRVERMTPEQRAEFTRAVDQLAVEIV